MRLWVTQINNVRGPLGRFYKIWVVFDAGEVSYWIRGGIDIHMEGSPAQEVKSRTNLNHIP